MIETLATPIILKTEFGSLMLTHRRWSASFDFSREPDVVYSIHEDGIVRSDGTFIPESSTRSVFAIRGAKLGELLAPNSFGKRAGEFRTDDIRAIHQEHDNFQPAKPVTA